MNPRYDSVAARAGHRCEYCRAPELVFNFPFEVEHILPLAKGGTSQDDNLALSCRSCNLKKGTCVESIDPVTGATAAIFHPRQDTWSDHFQASEITGAITGLSPKGRITTARLNLNSTLQLAARVIWIQIGLFP